jgi:glycosyltransferase involved in cell wall biosynthesis
MTLSFAPDPFPGKPRILFIGASESTHTHAWINVIEGEQFNVQLFGIPGTAPPNSWPVRTYVTLYDGLALDPATRKRLYPANRLARFVKWRAPRGGRERSVREDAKFWLARIIRQWQPDIVHTLGLDPAGELYYDARRQYELQGIGKWILQLRGGSDLTLQSHDPARRDSMAPVLRACDQLLTDNPWNFDVVKSLGVRDEQLSRIGTVPGTGGIDIDSLAQNWRGAPSSRRLILWPKVYEGPWSKVLPVYEALKACWERLQPCELHMLSMNAEARSYYWTLPEHIRRWCHPNERVSRAQVLELTIRARVMLAPSLVDGVPNSMYEAMAAGALPIVSPLETIRPVVEQERNVLFARNLYPEEIAGALTRAMTDDALVDSAAKHNLELVRRIANRAEIQPRVVKFYNELAGQPASKGN